MAAITAELVIVSDLSIYDSYQSWQKQVWYVKLKVLLSTKFLSRNPEHSAMLATTAQFSKMAANNSFLMLISQEPTVRSTSFQCLPVLNWLQPITWITVKVYKWMTSSCNSKMATKEHLQCSYLRKQRFDRWHFNAYIDTTYHLDHVIWIRIDDVVMQYQDGRQRTPQGTVRSQETSVRPQEISVRSQEISVRTQEISWDLNKTSGDLKRPQ